MSGPHANQGLPFDTSRPVSELSMVEIAEQLEKVSNWIDGERVREREAKTVYDGIAREVETKVKAIHNYAEQLISHHRKKINAFDGLLGKQSAPAPKVNSSGAKMASFSKQPTGSEPKNLAEAIIKIWTLSRYAEPLTTEEIADALEDVGYRTDAAESSIRSSINQALAKLAKVGRIIKYRADGSQIEPRDQTSRARRYLAAIRLPEPV